MITAAEARERAKPVLYEREEVENFILYRIEDHGFKAIFSESRWSDELTSWLESLGYIVEIVDGKVEVTW